MPSWRPARCLTTLRDEINRAYPNRDRASDGIIGDQAHASRKSDHNPDSKGVVHAIDIDKDGIPADDIVNNIITLALQGDKRLTGGYVIWRGRIASHSHAWTWRPYTGSNRHDKHFHLSVTYEPACDSTQPWNVVPVSPPEPVPPSSLPTILEEDDMEIIVPVNDAGQPDPDAIWLRVGNRLQYVKPDELAKFEKAKVKKTELDPEAFYLLRNGGLVDVIERQ